MCYEIPLFNSLRPSSPLPPSDALWLLHVGPFRVDGGIRSDGLSLLHTEQGGIDHHLCLPCPVVPTFHQNCPWTHHLECGGCDGGDSVGAVMDEGKKRNVSPFLMERHFSFIAELSSWRFWQRRKCKCGSGTSSFPLVSHPLNRRRRCRLTDVVDVDLPMSTTSILGLCKEGSGGSGIREVEEVE